jgi:hypothetical protein
MLAFEAIKADDLVMVLALTTVSIKKRHGRLAMNSTVAG